VKPLSPREEQVMELVCTGATNEQIARKLGISMHTVVVHLEHARVKLGERYAPRARAAVLFVKRGEPPNRSWV
jgi:NarL family two-component system response regulator LiaR